MAEYLPFQKKHSIQEAQISIPFLGSFDQRSIEKARGFAQAELSEELPLSAEAHARPFEININDFNSPALLKTTPPELVGFRLSKVQGNGQQARVLLLEHNVLSASIMDYESWEATRKDALKYLRPVLVSLPLEENPVAAFSLRFIDRYTYSGRPSEARAELLFAKENSYVAPYIFEAGPTWHCNTGWFDSTAATGRDRVLHNLNISSQPIDRSSTVMIDHHATIHVESPRQSMPALCTPPDEELGLMQALDILHDQNKEILKSMLLPEMLSRIGLDA